MPPSRATRFGAAAVLVAAGVLAISSCTAEPDPSRSTVLLVGVDGLEWSVVLPLVREGRLPVLAGLMAEGSFGYLRTLPEALSPIVWTSVATGKEPEKHGIRGFVKEGVKPPELYSNGDRTTKALWNILTDAERPVLTVGWWMTFPTERVHGTMVAQTNTRDQIRPQGPRAPWKGTLVPGLDGQVSPAELQAPVLDIAARVDDSLDELTRLAFGDFAHPLTGANRKRWEESRWSFRADSTYLRVALDLLGRSEEPPELAMVYFGSPDVMGHRFWRFFRPEDFTVRPRARDVDALGGILPSSYVWVDSAIGALVEALDDPTVLVVSDHGMHAIRRGRDWTTRPGGNSGHHMSEADGVLIAAGPLIRRAPAFDPTTASAEAMQPDELPVVGSVLDVAPTILALKNLPVGRDMDGEVLERLIQEGFLNRFPPRFVDSHDSADWLESRPREPLSSEAAEERLEQLRALGYVE